MLRLALRILPLFAVIVGLAMALGAYMNFSGVRGAYLDLIGSRMQMVADEVGVVVESAVSLGIPPSEQVTLPALLARQAEADPLIVSIAALAPDGTALFSSGASGNGAGDRARAAGDTLLLQRPVLNDFGVEVARIVLAYDRSAPSARIEGFAGSILADAVPAGLIAALAGSLAALLVLTRLYRRGLRTADPQAQDALAAAAREIEAAAEPPGRAS